MICVTRAGAVLSEICNEVGAVLSEICNEVGAVSSEDRVSNEGGRDESGGRLTCSPWW